MASVNYISERVFLSGHGCYLKFGSHDFPTCQEIKTMAKLKYVECETLSKHILGLCFSHTDPNKLVSLGKAKSQPFAYQQISVIQNCEFGNE